ncbi:MAG TPA: hypothetical protein PL009_08995 [Flavipsychrobacter sp.]|nr:hypothetical protein [Flavipsychrobacter sp.]
MKKLTLSIAVVAAMIAGCKKDDKDQSRRDMITGAWTISQGGTDANNNGIIDAGEVENASDTTMSGTMTFNNNGTAAAVFNVMGLPIGLSGTWELVNNENALRMISTFAGSTDTSYFEIKALSTSNLTLRDTLGASMNDASWIVLKK